MAHESSRTNGPTQAALATVSRQFRAVGMSQKPICDIYACRDTPVMAGDNDPYPAFYCGKTAHGLSAICDIRDMIRDRVRVAKPLPHSDAGNGPSRSLLRPPAAHHCAHLRQRCDRCSEGRAQHASALRRPCPYIAPSGSSVRYRRLRVFPSAMISPASKRARRSRWIVRGVSPRVSARAWAVWV